MYQQVVSTLSYILYPLFITLPHYFQQIKHAGERGGYAHARAHARARKLPSPEALSSDIEEGAVNRSPLQVLFFILLGVGWTATGLGAILIQPMDYARGLVFSGISRPLAVPIGLLIGRGLIKKL